jgi:hypothetical protein
MAPWWVVGTRLLTKCLAVGPQLPSALSPFLFFFLKSFIIKSILFCLCGERERGNLQSQYNRELLTSTLAFLPGQKKLQKFQVWSIFGFLLETKKQVWKLKGWASLSKAEGAYLTAHSIN